MINTIAIAARLAPARVLDEQAVSEERVLRYGAPLWEADAALPIRRDRPTLAELQLAALAVAWFRR